MWAFYNTHSDFHIAIANKLFECVWPICGVGAQKVNWKLPTSKDKQKVAVLNQKDVA